MADELVGVSDARPESRKFLNENVLVGFAVFVIFVIGGLVLLHFQFGLDIPLVGIKNYPTAAYWGQIGDFVGGILNPILSFIALLAVVINLRMQSSELKIARKEAKEVQENQAQQTKIFSQQSKLIEKQSFESVFFGMLQLHAKNVEGVTLYDDSHEYNGLEVFDFCADRYSIDRVPLEYAPSVEQAFTEHAQRFYNFTNTRLGHYFRTLYEMFVYVDSFGNVVRKNPLAVNLASLDKQVSENSTLKKTYARVLAAALSSSEIECLLLYCLTTEGESMRKLCEKYGFLKHSPRRENLEKVKILFDSTAFR